MDSAIAEKTQQLLSRIPAFVCSRGRLPCAIMGATRWCHSVAEQLESPNKWSSGAVEHKSKEKSGHTFAPTRVVLEGTSQGMNQAKSSARYGGGRASVASSRTSRAGRALSCTSEIARQPLWTTGEAALMLRCSVKTVRRELRQGTIRGVRLSRLWRIPASQFGPSLRALSSPECPQVGTTEGGRPLSASRVTTPRQSGPQPSMGSARSSSPTLRNQPPWTCRVVRRRG